MARRQSLAIDPGAPPFDQLSGIQRLSADRSGHGSGARARHELYVARDRRTRMGALIKVTSRPGLVYQQDLTNEIASLTTINRERPGAPYFPLLAEHGRLHDGRVYLVTSLFDEFPLASSIGTERMPGRTVAHLRTAIEVGRALDALHGLPIFHVDLNPMNVLYRWEQGRPLIRVVDFESSYEPARHGAGTSYNPPTTPRYSAPEISRQPPDARADVFSLGAVLYTMLATLDWTREAEVGIAIEKDKKLDGDLKAVLLGAVDPDPRGRYGSIQAFLADLGAHLERIWPGRSW